MCPARAARPRANMRANRISHHSRITRIPAGSRRRGHAFATGTPLGGDSASVHVGSVAYRAQKLLDMTDAHDTRLRSVVGLARRSGTTGASTQRISVQLSQLLLRWCCNTRNVHLLRGVPARLVEEAARRHDQSVKVACAASLGFFDVSGDDVPEFLHGVSDASLPPAFVKAYQQICLDAKVRNEPP